MPHNSRKMDSEKSSTTRKCVRETTAKAATTFPSGTTRMLQSVVLIWLDVNIDAENNEDRQSTIKQLQHIVHSVKLFRDVDECVTFLLKKKNDKVVMIIPDSLAQLIVPRVHHISQLDSVFIFCTTTKCYEQWTKDWSKIKGMYTEIEPIYQAVEAIIHQCEENAIPISFIPTSDSDSASNKSLDQLDCSFMYTHILKEILLTITFEEQHFNEFIEFCRKESTVDIPLANVQQFEREYRDRTPIWWYTSEYFLYSKLNRALRVLDVDVTIKMGFFMNDLHHHIDQLYHEQFQGENTGKSFIVYRGQGLFKANFDQLLKTKGGLLSFNNFLSTSKDRAVSLMFAESSHGYTNLVGVLFVMKIDSSLSTTPFAFVPKVSRYQENEKEVLFSMHTVFRINSIETVPENEHLSQVNLILTNDNDPDLRILTDHIRKETFPHEKGWVRLGQLLFKLGESKKAQRVYEFLLERASSDVERAPLYHHIARAKDNLGEYEEAIKLYKTSLEIFHKILPPCHPSLTLIYNNVGSVYDNIGNYSDALLYYEKALEIGRTFLPPNDPDLATCYNNIGLLYDNLGDYQKALLFLQKALEIYKKTLPSNHPTLATSYNNIGLVYDIMGHYSEAVSSYEKALEIYKKTLPPDHSDLGSYYNNIGLLYDNLANYSEALSYYEKALEIKQKTLPSNHSSLATSYNNVGLLYDKMGNYSKALSFNEKALEIYQKSLPPDHPDLATSYNSIGLLYDSLGDYSKALLFHTKALEIIKKSLPPDHPSLAPSYNNIASVYINMKDFPKALSYYERSHKILTKAFAPDHPTLAASYYNIAATYLAMDDCSKALSFSRKAVDIGQRTLSANHPNLELWKNALELIKKLCLLKMFFVYMTTNRA
jgi:tetratricopeptide (TPR) repeat protein